MAVLFWVLAAVLIVLGIMQLLTGSLFWGVVLIVIGVLVPGGAYYTRP